MDHVKNAKLATLPSVDCDPDLPFEPIPGITVASEWPCPACGEQHGRLLMQSEAEKPGTVYYRIDCWCGAVLYYSRVTYLETTESDGSVTIRPSGNVHMRPVA